MITHWPPLAVRANCEIRYSGNPITGRKNVVDVEAPLFLVPKIVRRSGLFAVILLKKGMIGADHVFLSKELHNC
jgi:hypothetical protein